MTFEEVIRKLEDQQITVAQFLYKDNIKGIGKIDTIQEARPAYESDEMEYTIRYLVDQDMYIRTAVDEDSYGAMRYPYGYGRVVNKKEKLVTLFE